MQAGPPERCHGATLPGAAGGMRGLGALVDTWWGGSEAAGGVGGRDGTKQHAGGGGGCMLSQVPPPTMGLRLHGFSPEPRT